MIPSDDDVIRFDEQVQERAAILEFDAGFERAEAESLAVAMTMDAWGGSPSRRKKDR
jgi:hypothetical protein